MKTGKFVMLCNLFSCSFLGEEGDQKCFKESKGSFSNQERDNIVKLYSYQKLKDFKRFPLTKLV